VAYVKVGEENGGIVLNLSESGLELSVGEALGLDDTLDLSLQLAYRATPIEATGRVVWLSDSKRTAGLQFISVADQARRRIQDWVAVERAGGNAEAAQSLGVQTIEPEPTSTPPAAISQGRFAKIETFPPETSRQDPHPPMESSSAPNVFTHLPEPVPASEVAFEPPKIDRAERRTPSEPTHDQSASRFQFGSSILTPDQPPSATSDMHPDHIWTPLQLAAITGGMVLCFAAGAFVGTNWMGKRSHSPAPAQTSQPPTPSASTPPTNGKTAAKNMSPGAPGASQPPATAPQTSPDAAAVPDNSIEVTAPDENDAASAVTLPQQAVTASDSIAISVRQTAGIPPEPGFAYEHRAKRLEGSRIAPPQAPSLPEGISIDSGGDVVHLQASLDEHGEISDISAISGRTDLVSIAENIVRGWLQTPARLAGKPLDSIEDITITFRPAPAAPTPQ
jgi:PilZ domain